MPLINYIGNRQESLGGGLRGMARERDWSTISASYYATPTTTTGSLSIKDSGATITTLTASGSKFNARISSSNEMIVNLTGSVSNATLTGSFTMSLIVTSSDYSYSATVYSFGELSTTLFPTSASVYSITGSLTYDSNGGTFGTCSYYWIKSGDNFTQPITASYTQCGATGSTQLYFSSSLVTQSVGCCLNDTVYWTPDSIETADAQVWVSPYSCDFLYPTASSLGNRSVRFETPQGVSNPASNYYLASWVPNGSNVYQFQILKPGETLTVCTADIKSAFFSKGSDVKFANNYIIDLGTC